MSIQRARGNAQGVVGVRGPESQLWRLGVKAKRNRNGGVGLALIARRILQPKVEKVLARTRGAKAQFSVGVDTAHNTGSTFAIATAELPVNSDNWGCL
jgi:hypothetical protein